MIYKQNLHTHTKYCDGADTPEELILEAIERGFDSIGFSGHSFMTYSPLSVKLGDHTAEYKRHIPGLKEIYKDRIKVYMGLEVDMYSNPDMTGYDYLIGSVHYLDIDGSYVGFDHSADVVEDVIKEHFGGDGMRYVRAYYEAVSKLPRYGNFDIIGHFDLITKHIDKREFFDISSGEYMAAALEAAEALVGKIPFFELNTGAIARGYRNTPYPSLELMRELKRLGFGVVITSDCHSKNMLDCQFEEAAELCKACGFKEKYVLTDSGFTAVSL